MNSDQKKYPPAPTRVSTQILARAKPTIPQETTRSKPSPICSKRICVCISDTRTRLGCNEFSNTSISSISTNTTKQQHAQPYCLPLQRQQRLIEIARVQHLIATPEHKNVAMATAVSTTTPTTTHQHDHLIQISSD